jgi:hypothetical protein
MNNKYDVKNFSDLIDKFDCAEEVKVIQDNLRQEIEESRVEP